MKYRPLCIGAVVLIVLLWFARIVGLPIFGEPILPERLSITLRHATPVSVTGIISDRQIKTNSTQYLLSDTTVRCQKQSFNINKIKLTVSEGSDNQWAVGTSVLVYGDLKKITAPANPGMFDSRTYYASQHIFYELYANAVLEQDANMGQSMERTEFASKEKSYSGMRNVFYRLKEHSLQLREKAANTLQQSLGAEKAGVLQAMLLGDKSALDDEIRADYQASGIIHVLSISGLHILMLGGLLYRLLMRLFCSVRVAAVGSLSLLLGYCLFVGSPVSTVRALLMYAVLMGARVSKRSYDTLNALALAAILMLFENRNLLFYSGFQLSFAAVIGAAVVYPYLMQLIPQEFWRKGSKKKKYLEELLHTVVAWAAIMLMTIPLLAYHFYEIPLLSLVTNLLLVPCMSFMMCAGFLGMLVGFASALLARVCLLPAGVCIQLFSLVTGAIRKCPHSVWICGQPTVGQVIFYYAMLGVVLLLIKCKRVFPGIALTMTAFIVLFIRVRAPFSLTMLDVGQGNCMVVQKKRTVFLVDGGSSSETAVGKYRIIPYLKQQGIREIEGVLVTHPDSDHYNGIEELLLAIGDGSVEVRIQTLLMPLWMQEDETGMRLAEEAEAIGTEVRYVCAGDVIEVQDTPDRAMRIVFYHPFENSGVREGNGGSAVCVVSYDGFTALLTGDLEKEGEIETIPYLPDVDVLQVGHHGSRYATSEELLAKTMPDWCLVSAPYDSMYGHPHEETLVRIEAAGAVPLLTGDCGAISFYVRDGCVDIKSIYWPN